MDAFMVFLAPGSLNHTANIIKGFAIAIGIAIAITFVWMWWAARLRERRLELSARARAVYTAHLRLAVQYPELSQPMAGSISSPVEMARYREFVAALLSAAEEILLLDPAPVWRDTLALQLAPHLSYLASAEFTAARLKSCSPAVRTLFSRA